MIIAKLTVAIFATAMTVSVTAQTAAPAASPPASATAAPPAQAAQPAKVKKVCQTMQTGSLIPKRVCMTPQEWADFQEKNGMTANEINRTNATRCTMGGIC